VCRAGHYAQGSEFFFLISVNFTYIGSLATKNEGGSLIEPNRNFSFPPRKIQITGFLGCAQADAQGVRRQCAGSERGNFKNAAEENFQGGYGASDMTLGCNTPDCPFASKN
jgi:hypothetical protein